MELRFGKGSRDKVEWRDIAGFLLKLDTHTVSVFVCVLASVRALVLFL